MRPFTRVLLFCKLYSKGFKSILWGGGEMLRLVCNVRVSQTYIDSVWFVQVSGFQVAESGDGEE